MDWYYRLLAAIAKLLAQEQTLEVTTLLSILLEPVYGPEQELAVALAETL